MAAAKKIREDLFGTITVHTKNGTVFLRAGDKVPAGVDVAASQIAGDSSRAESEESKEADDDAGNRRGRRSSTRRGDS